MIQDRRITSRIALLAIAGGILMVWDLVAETSLPGWIFLGLAVLGLGLFLLRTSPRPPGAAELSPIVLTPGMPPRLRELFRESLRLGAIGFGGGLAVLSQVEARLVLQRRWIRERLFLEAAALAQSLPGAVATNALALIGYRLRGLAGAIAMLTGFVTPSFLLMLAFALAYPWVRHLGAVDGVFKGLNPAVVGLVATTAVRLGGQVRLTPDGRPGGWQALWRDPLSLLVVVGSALAAGLWGYGVVQVLLFAGLFGIVRGLPGVIGVRHGEIGERWRWFRRRVREVTRTAAARTGLPWWRRWRDGGGDLPVLVAPWLLVISPLAPTVAARLAALGSLSAIFLRAGALTFGGGFVMIPLLEAELVRAHPWMSRMEFADAMALGQVTPGPVVITSTFVGYRVAGLTGAILATASVFLPAFLIALALEASIDRFRANEGVQAFLHGIQPAVVGLMFAAAAVLFKNGALSWVGGFIAALSFALLWRWQLNAMWVLLIACVLGLLARLLGV